MKKNKYISYKKVDRTKIKRDSLLNVIKNDMQKVSAQNHGNSRNFYEIMIADKKKVMLSD